MQRECVVYSRFSPRPGEELSLSLEIQHTQCRAYAQASGWNITHYFDDAGVSGKDTDRPGLQKMLHHLGTTRGRKQVLLTYSISRLARCTKDMLELADFIERLGVDLACVSEKIDTSSPMGRFVFTLMGALNQLEREQVGKRTSDAMSTMVLRGYSPGKVPHGFKVVDTEVLPNGRKRTKVELDDTTRPIYRTIYDMRMLNKWTHHQIAEYLNSVGMESNGPWTRNRVRRALEAIERYGLLASEKATRS